MGHDVVSVPDAWSALAHARRYHPELIVSDIRMSGLDGYGLVRTLRSDPEIASIPMIAVTGMSARGDMDAVRKAGSDACLCKPVEDD